MIHLNEYILNDDIVNLLEELINAKQAVSENMISDDDIVKLFESNKLNFEPKNKDELENLFSAIDEGDNSPNYEAIDELNEKWMAFCNKNFKSIKDKMPWKLKADENSNLPNTISFDNIAIGIRSEGFVCGDFNSKNKKFGSNLRKSIEYNYDKSFFVNLLLLLEKAKLLKQVFDGSCDDGYLKLNINDKSKFTLEDAVKLSKSSEKNDDENDNNKNEDIKKVEKEVIEDNKDLIKQLLVKANTNAEKVTSVINKICKGIKTDESTVLGLTVMICGMLMSVKKNGKGNKIAVKTLAEKIVKITSNKKSGIRNILK